MSQVTPVMQQQNSDAALLLSLSPPMKPFSVITPTLKPLDVVGGRNRSLSLDILCDAAESALSYGSLMQQQKQLPVVGTTRSLTLKRERYSCVLFHIINTNNIYVRSYARDKVDDGFIYLSLGGSGPEGKRKIKKIREDGGQIIVS